MRALSFEAGGLLYRGSMPIIRGHQTRRLPVGDMLDCAIYLGSEITSSEPFFFADTRSVWLVWCVIL